MDYNRTIQMGRLTADPELRMTNNNTPVCEVGLAVNRYYTTAGEQKKDTMFIDVVFWNGRASTIAQHAKKGSAILVEGRLEQDRWVSKDDGKQKSRIRIVADTFQFVGSRPDSASSSSDNSESSETTESPDFASEATPTTA